MKRRNFLRATLWTETLRIDIEGKPAAGIRDLFLTLSLQAQTDLLNRLQADLQERRERTGLKCRDTAISF